MLEKKPRNVPLSLNLTSRYVNETQPAPKGHQWCIKSHKALSETNLDPDDCSRSALSYMQDVQEGVRVCVINGYMVAIRVLGSGSNPAEINEQTTATVSL